MEHHYIELDGKSGVKTLVIYHRDNNLDKKDNLNTLPPEPAVYALCGRVNGQPANPRYIGQTINLREKIIKHFDRNESNSNKCLKEFMQSIKIKELIYQLMPDSTDYERVCKKKQWEDKYRPECTEALNKIH